MLVVVVKVGIVMITELIELLLAVNDTVEVRVKMTVLVVTTRVTTPAVIVVAWKSSDSRVVMLMQITGCTSLHGLATVVVDSKAKQVPVVEPIQKIVSPAA